MRKTFFTTFFFTLMLVLTLVFNTKAQLTATDSTISGNISQNVVLSANKKYLLNGFVYVDSTYSITIPAGTVIMGDKASKGTLIIKRGAKIFANGTATNPVVFTSQQPAGTRAPGDWGGVVICGAARTNQPGNNVTIEGGVAAQYGGNDDNDNSGIMRYVRIEFPGVAFLPNNEINGLTMGGVGSGTTIEYIQVSYSGDDSFEWFGGTVNAKYLVAYKGLDDDFDTDFGYRGKVQFGLSFRDPQLADQSRSEAFESDNTSGGEFFTPRTQPVFSNFTLVGPKQTSSSTNFNPLFYYGVHERRSTLQSIHNSVFMGWPSGGILIDGTNVRNALTNDTIRFKNNVVSGSIKAGSNVAGFDVFGWFNTGSYANDSITEPASLNLRNPYNSLNPDLRPNSGSALLSGASFTDLSDPFFTSVSYRGAFGNDVNRWDAGWSNYDPQSTVYNSNIDWVSNIRVVNSLDETRSAVFGRGTGATDGVDASFGETLLPPALSSDVDIRFVLPSSTNEVGLDIRNTGSVSGNVLVYRLKVQSGTAATGTMTVKWDPNLLGAGRFFISDSLGGALFPITNMKSSASVSMPGNNSYTLYIYVYTRYSQTIVIGNNWNMVSFPGNHPNGNLPDTLFRGRKLTSNVFGFNGSYVTASSLVPGTGYWMEHSGNRNYVWNGTVQSSVLYPQIEMVKRSNISVNSGWNMFGVFDYNVSTSNLTTIPANMVSGLIFAYSPGSGYTPAGTLEPGAAYWVNMTGTGNLVLPGVYSGLAKFAPQYNVINKEWSKVTVTDANGSSYTLYVTDKGENLDSYNLPPLAPVSVFDVRFGSNRFVEDLSVSSNTIQLSGVQYPVKVRVEGINVNLSNTLANINTNVTSGNEITINNPSVNFLTISSGNEVPSQFSLSQNYPNPFNPSTVISFSLPETSNISLTIYNSLGELVKELYNGNMDAGNHKVEFNASGLSSGIYFYKLTTDNFSSIKKMTLTK